MRGTQSGWRRGSEKKIGRSVEFGALCVTATKSATGLGPTLTALFSAADGQSRASNLKLDRRGRCAIWPDLPRPDHLSRSALFHHHRRRRRCRHQSSIEPRPSSRQARPPDRAGRPREVFDFDEGSAKVGTCEQSASFPPPAAVASFATMSTRLSCKLTPAG